MYNEKKAKKNIIILSIMMVLILSGVFFTVNAATNGELMTEVKENIKSIFLKEFEDTNLKIDENTLEITDYETDENGDVIVNEFSFEADAKDGDNVHYTVNGYNEWLELRKYTK